MVASCLPVLSDLIRAGSSAGRASRSQCEGRGFDPHPVHHLPTRSNHRPGFFLSPYTKRTDILSFSNLHTADDKALLLIVEKIRRPKIIWKWLKRGDGPPLSNPSIHLESSPISKRKLLRLLSYHRLFLICMLRTSCRMNTSSSSLEMNKLTFLIKKTPSV